MDILLSYPLLAAQSNLDKMGHWEKGSARQTYPIVFAYMDRLEAQPGWKRAIEKTKEIDDGKFMLYRSVD